MLFIFSILGTVLGKGKIVPPTFEIGKRGGKTFVFVWLCLFVRMYGFTLKGIYKCMRVGAGKGYHTRITHLQRWGSTL